MSSGSVQVHWWWGWCAMLCWRQATWSSTESVVSRSLTKWDHHFLTPTLKPLISPVSFFLCGDSPQSDCAVKSQTISSHTFLTFSYFHFHSCSFLTHFCRKSVNFDAVCGGIISIISRNKSNILTLETVTIFIQNLSSTFFFFAAAFMIAIKKSLTLPLLLFNVR